MTESIQLIFAILGISSAFMLFTLVIFVNLHDRKQDIRGFALGIFLSSVCTFTPSLFFILWYYGVLAE